MLLRERYKAKANKAVGNPVDQCFQKVIYPVAATYEYLQSVPDLCSCSELLLSCEGGEAALKAWQDSRP